MSLKPQALWELSQNGLLADWPHRQRPMAVRPARPKAWPAGSTISKSPSTRIDPLLLMITLAAAIQASEKTESAFGDGRRTRSLDYADFNGNSRDAARASCSFTSCSFPDRTS